MESPREPRLGASLTEPAPRIFLSAGDPSADLHGAALARALRLRLPGAELEALGGPRMAAAGVRVRFPQERYSVMGMAELVLKLPIHVRLLRRLAREFSADRYALAVLLDYPGFNLRVAEAARRAGVKVLYYIAPKYWASGEGRIPRLRQAIDRLAVVLPFEQEFFAKHGLTADFVGHPLLDQEPAPARQVARTRLGLTPEQRVLALFPGSRPQELRRIWPPFRDAARRLLADGSCDRVLVAGTKTGAYPELKGLTLIRDQPDMVLGAADAALVKSGTATLEAALAGVPMVVGYRMHPVTAWMARRILTVPFVSLVNLLLERPVVEELLQESCTSDRLANAAGPLLHPEGAAAARQREAFAALRDQLGEPGASARVAGIAAELLA